jgi:SAM-dependent methyltransferase
LSDWRNSTGYPLSSPAWLEAHHRAKLRERTEYALGLTLCQPTRVVDLGCATGLWLDVLNDVLPPSCEFVGLDCDPEALAAAQLRSERWLRKTTFELCDLSSDADAIPGADLTLVFNLFSYLPDPQEFLANLSKRDGHGLVAIRQYDGAALRFGPMDVDARSAVEASLRAAVSTSREFNHYDMDAVFVAVSASPLSIGRIEFELFQRVVPFPADFLAYYEGMVDWTLAQLSDHAQDLLGAWLAAPMNGAGPARYFFEIDLTAVLS